LTPFRFPLLPQSKAYIWQLFTNEFSPIFDSKLSICQNLCCRLAIADQLDCHSKVAHLGPNQSFFSKQSLDLSVPSNSGFFRARLTLFAKLKAAAAV
jgi:hypothetical protein